MDKALTRLEKRARPRVQRGPDDGVPSGQDRIAAVMAKAHESGLTLTRGGRIAARVSPELIQRAKDRTGIQSDTELLEYALANVAIEDDFLSVFARLKGSVDPGLALDF